MATCLTFEVRRDRRIGARPARRMIDLGASRAWCQAVGPRLDRGVRPHVAHLARTPPSHGEVVDGLNLVRDLMGAHERRAADDPSSASNVVGRCQPRNLDPSGISVIDGQLSVRRSYGIRSCASTVWIGHCCVLGVVPVVSIFNPYSPSTQNEVHVTWSSLDFHSPGLT